MLDSIEAIDRRHDHGPFDVIGDVHGCSGELVRLLALLGYAVEDGRPSVTHPGGRRPVFVGDLVDRGPDTPGVLRLVMAMVRDGAAFCVAGNHDQKLARALAGESVSISRGRAMSLAQLDGDAELRESARRFLAGLPSHHVFDAGRLVVAHAGLAEALHGQPSAQARSFALYGSTTGERDARGFPVCLDWAGEYHGSALVVYGHIAVPEPRWVGNTVNIETGCVFGGSLTALRYPERETVSVSAARVYFTSSGHGPAGTQPAAIELRRFSPRGNSAAG